MRKTLVSRVWKRAVAVMTGIVLLLSAFPLLPTSAVSVDTQAALLSAISRNQAIELTADIALSGTWTTPTNTYSATFDGKGYVISGISAPLISTLSGTVQNVGLMCADGMNGEGMLAKTSSGTVTGVFAYGKMSYSGTDPVGGMIGEVTAGSVTKCFSCIEITTSTGDYVGGLIGKLTAGTLTSCYASGSIVSTGAVASSNSLAHTAGLAYAVDSDKNGTIEATVSDTYSSVQLRSATPYAKPSGVNGLYDNQLSIVRESAANTGLSTRELMDANTLSEAFAVTSTAYPALTNFYNKMWGPVAQNVVRVSTAAAAFTDVDSSKRMEPTTKFVARADYLLAETVVDRTNVASLTWDVNSTACQVYDAVPFTADNGSTKGTSADLLRAKLVFSSDAADVAMTATSGTVKRTWYLTVKRSANPYFASGKGTSSSVFGIANKTQLHYVRYYTRIDTAYYKQTANISVGGNWPPITDFRGTYDGGSKLLYNMTSVKDGGETGFGFIGNTYAAATIKNIYMRNMYFTGNRNVPTGLLVGKANAALTIDSVSLSGNSCSVKGPEGGYVGGLVGHANGKLTMSNCLLSIQITRGATTGGLVGYISVASSSIKQCGVTGYVTGTKHIGGLVGQTSKSTTIQHCYSTAVVVSDAAADSNYAGGLVGNAASATITYSYCAALTDAPNFTGKGVIVGTSGTVNNTVYYDKVYLVGTPSGQNANATAKSTTELIAQTINSSYWKTDGVHYPQVTSHTSKSYFESISPVATLPVYFQQYWEDTPTGDITTGFIADSTASTSSNATITIDQPASQSTFNSTPAQTVYAFTNGTDSGWSFEAGSGQRRMMVYCKSRTSEGVTDANNNSGIRVIAVVRDDLVPLKYSVTGVSGARAYVELYYSKDKTNWQGAGVMTTGGGTAKVLYDMPKGSYVKVKVATADDYKVSSVTIGGTSYSTATNGFYVSSGTFSSSTSVTVTLASNTPPWGLRRQTH